MRRAMDHHTFAVKDIMHRSIAMKAKCRAVRASGLLLLCACSANSGGVEAPRRVGMPAAGSAAMSGSGVAAVPDAGSSAGPPVENAAPISPPPNPASAGSGGAPAPTTDARADEILRGSCKTSTVESKLLPANILFVLDRSASMLCNPPPTTQSTLCEQQPERAKADQPSKWETTTQSLVRAIRALPGTTTIGLSYFSNDNECGVNASPSVPLAINNGAQQDAIERSIGGVSPGGGTPIVGATILAYSHLHSAALAGKIKGNEFVVLITDGAQSEQCSYAPRCSDAASCTDLLIQSEVPKAAGPGAGIRTFVIGVPGSEPARKVLSQIARLGGTAPDGCDPEQGNCHFDMTSAADLSTALNGALAKIAGQAISCELNVPKPDTGALDPNLVNVVYTPGGGKPPAVLRQDTHAPCDAGANGWQYADMNQKIRLCGEACSTVQSDPVARVDVVLGCPSLLQ